MCGWQAKLCDPLVTREPYLSALGMQYDKALTNSRYFTQMKTVPLLVHRPNPV